MGVNILTDSTSYINKDLLKDLGIHIVSLNVAFPDITFKETEIKNDTFYDMMAAKGIPLSSQPSVGDLYEKMKELTSNGDSLVCVFISSEMSGTYSSALMVKKMILEERPETKIEVLDSKSNCMQLGFAAVAAARAAKAGKSFEEVKRAASENISKSRFIFIPDNLEYLKKGGRIGGASALLGDLFKIIPILTVKNGKTYVLEKVRTKKKAILHLIEKLLSDISLYGLGEVVIHHINCINEAYELAESLKEKLNINVSIADIGPVIGLHVGPGAIGIAYYTENYLE